MVGFNKKGISVIICCYNSVSRLPETLKHLAAQSVEAAIPWELIVVDNASTDQTAEVAVSEWRRLGGSIPIKIVAQPIPGLSSARQKGFESARFEYLLLCDDDNWLDAHFIKVAYHRMASNPEIGVLGGQSQPEFGDLTPPAWFGMLGEAYAVGKQAEQSGDITDSRGYVWGAGMIIRRSALQYLYTNGFQLINSDRKGSTLTSGGDTELCHALALAGYQIWYDSDLQFRHLIPANRLNWAYIRKLSVSFGAAEMVNRWYSFAKRTQPSYIAWLKEAWLYQFYTVLRSLIIYRKKLLKTYRASAGEGDMDVVWIEMGIGHLQMLLRSVIQYGKNLRKIKKAPWLKTL